MIIVTRAQLTKAMPNADTATILAFEQLLTQYLGSVDTSIAATQALTDASLLTLSNNAALTNERVLTFDPTQFAMNDTGPGGAYVVALLSAIAATAGFRLSFNLGSDTYLDLPSSGRLVESTLGGAAYASDSAAATAGVKVGEIYRSTSGSVVWRQS